MKSIIFICPYFGKFPKEQMPLWLKTCEYNPTVDFIIFTDDTTAYQYPSNVRVEYMTFAEFINIIQQKFDFPIAINRPYKMCDFRPTYGYIFQDYITGYDYWGHCDMSDSIWGDFRQFITDDVLKSAEKIGFLGHLTIYRNNEDVNKRFSVKNDGKLQIENILGSEEHLFFDELGPYSINYSINSIYKQLKLPIKRVDRTYYDVSALNFAFQRMIYDDSFNCGFLPKKPTIFEWNRGKLLHHWVEDGHLNSEEILYVHLQKRKMGNNLSSLERYLITPKSFEGYKAITPEIVKQYSKDKLLYMKYFELRWGNLKYKIRHRQKIIPRHKRILKNDSIPG